MSFFFFFQAEDGIRDLTVTGVQTCALPISERRRDGSGAPGLASGPRGPPPAGQSPAGHRPVWLSPAPAVASGPPRRDQQVGVLVRALPLGVPLLPAPRGIAREAGGVYRGRRERQRRRCQAVPARISRPVPELPRS